MSKDIKVTVTKSVSSSGSANISIEVDEDPINLINLGNTPIHWDIDDPNKQGWKFTDDGIALKGSWSGKFVNHGAESGNKRYKWNRDNSDGIVYHYTISVTDDRSTATWDPSIINQ